MAQSERAAQVVRCRSPRRQCQQGAENAAEEHLPAGGGERVDGHVPALGEDGAGGPADAGAEDKDGAEELARSVAGVAGDARPEQDGDPDDAQRNAGDAARRDAVRAVTEALQGEEPERKDGGKERGQAGGDVGLRPSQDGVGGDEEKDSDEGQAQQVAARHPDAMSVEAAEAEHEQARRGVAQPDHQERSEMLDRDADG